MIVQNIKHRFKKEVVFISNMYPSDKDPTYGIFVKNIFESLSSQGIITRKIAIEGKPKTHLRKVFFYTLFIVRAIFKLSFTRNIVYVHYVAHSAIPVLFVSMYRSLQIVSHVHGGDLLSDKGTSSLLQFVKRSLAKRILSKSYKVVVPSSYFFRVAEVEFGVPKEALFISPSGGVDSRTFKLPPNKVVCASKRKFGYVGRLDQGKGLETLFQAVKFISKVNDNFSLSIVGDGVLSPFLKKLAAEIGIEKYISFVGKVAQDELPFHYGEFDFLIFPTEREGESLGLVGIESMACGTPVICSNMPGPMEYVNHGLNGFVFSAKDENELASYMLKAINIKDDEWNVMSKNALSTINKFSNKKVTSELVSIFQ